MLMTLVLKYKSRRFPVPLVAPGSHYSTTTCTAALNSKPFSSFTHKMKFSVKAISLIATSMFIPAIWASPVAEVGLESRAGVVPPAKGQSYRCDTSDSSPELDPLLKAAMAFINRKGQTCQQSNSKSTTQMYNRGEHLSHLQPDIDTVLSAY